MARLHIYIDGSWLFKVCGWGGTLSSRLAEGQGLFRLDFSKLCAELLRHAHQTNPDCAEFGKKLITMSIFQIPTDAEDWPALSAGSESIRSEDIERVTRSSNARLAFAEVAIGAGFDKSLIYQPYLKKWMIPKLRTQSYQEKRADTTLAATLVETAILCKDDFHAVVVGDSDLLPPIEVAKRHAEKVFLVTTSSEQYGNGIGQSSFGFSKVDFSIAPYYLDQHAEKLLIGEYIDVCDVCKKVFSHPTPIPEHAKPCCSACYQQRESSAPGRDLHQTEPLS